jgi:hypothetical protein
MVAHELMREPDPRVLQYVSQRPRLFNVSGFRDRCNVDSTLGLRVVGGGTGRYTYAGCAAPAGLSFVSLVDSYAVYLEERVSALLLTCAPHGQRCRRCTYCDI